MVSIVCGSALVNGYTDTSYLPSPSTQLSTCVFAAGLFRWIRVSWAGGAGQRPVLVPPEVDNGPKTRRIYSRHFEERDPSFCQLSSVLGHVRAAGQGLGEAGWRVVLRKASISPSLRTSQLSMSVVARYASEK